MNQTLELFLEVRVCGRKVERRSGDSVVRETPRATARKVDALAQLRVAGYSVASYLAGDPR